MEDIDKQIAIEKRKSKLLAEKEAADNKRKELALLRRENNPAYRRFKKIGATAGKLMANIEINRGMAGSGCRIGDEIVITNGSYLGKKMKIRRFIEGGVEGEISGQEVKIRHGSYYKK